MLQRCYNAKHNSYANYGGRGIEVCDRWRNSFENFLSDMGERPAGTQLDRINNDLGYSPENCRWVSPVENANNRGTNRPLTYKGETKNIKEWAKLLGVSHQAIGYRLKAGWPLEEVFERPFTHENRRRRK